MGIALGRLAGIEQPEQLCTRHSIGLACRLWPVNLRSWSTAAKRYEN